ncbi:MAG: NAD-dependent epimerase/dehydratase family protein [Candidatus Thorarchaeota archaeon]
MVKIFVTGATGQVGSHIVEHLISEKELEINNAKDIVCLVRNPEKASELKKLGVTLVKGDLQDSDTIFSTMKEIDYVFHIAANCLLNQTYEQMYIPNVLGTRILLEAFIQSNAKCFVYTSSIAVYDSFLGNKRIYHINEDSPIGPLKGEPYPVTKRIAEGLVTYYAERYPEKVFIITRLGPIIGKGDKQTIPSITSVMSYKFLPKLINGGRDLFSITSPLDVIRAQIFLATKGKEVSGQVFNVARDPITYREISEAIAEYYGIKPPKFSIKYWFFKLTLPIMKFFKTLFPRVKLLQTATSPLAVNYIGKSYIYDSSKLKSLGFKYIVSPKDAIHECLKDFDPEKKIIKVKRKSN